MYISCRAAMKMANIDAVFDFMFTNPKRKDGVRVTSVTVSFASLSAPLLRPREPSTGNLVQRSGKPSPPHDVCVNSVAHIMVHVPSSEVPQALTSLILQSCESHIPHYSAAQTTLCHSV